MKALLYIFLQEHERPVEKLLTYLLEISLGMQHIIENDLLHQVRSAQSVSMYVATLYRILLLAIFLYTPVMKHAKLVNWESLNKTSMKALIVSVLALCDGCHQKASYKGTSQLLLMCGVLVSSPGSWLISEPSRTQSWRQIFNVLLRSLVGTL